MRGCRIVDVCYAHIPLIVCTVSARQDNKKCILLKLNFCLNYNCLYFVIVAFIGLLCSRLQSDLYLYLVINQTEVGSTANILAHTHPTACACAKMLAVGLKFSLKY